MPDWRFEPDSWTRAAFQSVGDDLRDRRLQRGWSMRAVARRAGVAPSTILRLERGELAASLLLVVRVARALDGVIIGQSAPPPWSRAADIGLEPAPEMVADDPLANAVAATRNTPVKGQGVVSKGPGHERRAGGRERMVRCG